MISGLIEVARPNEPDAVERLADTLASLIPGVSYGLVGDAVIVSTRVTQALEILADGSGATLVQRPEGAPAWIVGAKAARREWVLCLEAGDVLREGWIRTLDRFTGAARADAVLGRGRRGEDGPVSRMVALWQRTGGASRPRAGDVVRRDKLLGESAVTPRLSSTRLPFWIDRA